MLPILKVYTFTLLIAKEVLHVNKCKKLESEVKNSSSHLNPSCLTLSHHFLARIKRILKF